MATTTPSEDAKQAMPRCPKCRQHAATTEHVTLVEPDDGRGATFRCRECKTSFRAKGPHARRAATAPPVAQAKPSTPPPATSRTGTAPARSPSPRDE